MIISLPLQFLFGVILLLFIVSMSIMVYYFDRKNGTNRWFTATILFMYAWAIFGSAYLYFPVDPATWVALQMFAGSLGSTSFYFFARNVSIPRYTIKRWELVFWLPAVYLFVVGALRIFVPEFHKGFSAALSVVNYTLKRQMDIHYLVYTAGFIIPAILGLSCMIRWSGRQNDASKRARLLTSLFSFAFLTVILFVFNTLATLRGLKLDPNYSNIAFTVSMCTVAISLMRDKAWKIEHLMDIIQKSEAALRVEKVKVDELLLNILPRDIAEELKASGKVSPISYESVSVLFTDFVGFSALSKSMDPPELLRKLDLHFSLYDDITARYGIEKLKTIGDSYMCAGGIPSANFTHPIDIVLTALEMQRETERLAHEEAENGMDGWHVRLGIHTGPLAAGIIGTKKFVYDIWGDTVNIASRMESAGLSGSVNISGETAELIRDFFAIQARGMIEVKNRGSLSMYLVSGILPELSDNGEGLAPNAKFRELRDRYTERKRG